VPRMGGAQAVRFRAIEMAQGSFLLLGVGR
jgi:hypothetical protein